MDLEGEVAVVTGAGRGIGRAIAIRLAQRGADLVLAARSVDALEGVAEAVRSLDREALVVPTDLREPDSISDLATASLERFGKIDVLVNNSGLGGPSAPLWEIDRTDWEETFAVNVTGTYLCCKAFLPGMIDRGRGSIVIIGSMTGKRPLTNRTPYASSKMALVGLTRTLADEVGPHGVRVNLVSPGAVAGERLEWVLQKQAEARSVTVEEARTGFESSSPLRRVVQPDDVANAVVYLASDAAAAVTGEDHNVTAGVVMY